MNTFTLRITLSLSLVCFLFLTCTPQLSSRFCTAADISYLSNASDNTIKDKYGRTRSICDQTASYIPDTNYLDHTPIKYIRLNFHWINTSDSSHNYYGRKAIEKTKGLLRASNYDLAKNNQMWLPHNNETPVLPMRFRYVLTPKPDDPDDDGIYFHFDDDIDFYVHKGKNRNIFDKTAFEKYGVQKDTVLNVFVMPHHPDSVKSKTYNSYKVGVALGNYVKIAGMYEQKDTYWNHRGCFNHEIGHIYGLSHTWRFNDGCDDTPKHKQECWVRDQRPGCDSLTSNNVMDYNAMQNSWSPCQIGRVQYRMASAKKRGRKFIEPTWCELKEEQHIFIRDSIDWICMKDLEGHLTIEPGASLTMRCRTSLPKGAKITVMPGGKLILNDARLHNACGEEWAGIEIQEQGGQKGEVIFIGEPKLENMANPLE